MTRKRLAGTKRKSEGQQRRHKKRSTKKTAAELPPGRIELSPIPDENPLEVLLDGLDEVLNKINEIAKDQERTPIAQVRDLLKTDYRITGADAENE